MGPAAPEEKILKELLKKFHFVTMATRVFDGIKLSTIFKEDLPRNIPAKFGPNWPSGLGGEDVKELLTMHDGHRTILKAPLEYVVLR